MSMKFYYDDLWLSSYNINYINEVKNALGQVVTENVYAPKKILK